MLPSFLHRQQLVLDIRQLVSEILDERRRDVELLDLDRLLLRIAVEFHLQVPGRRCLAEPVFHPFAIPMLPVDRS